MVNKIYYISWKDKGILHNENAGSAVYGIMFPRRCCWSCITYNAYFISLSTLCQTEIVSDFAMDLLYKTI